MAPDKMKKADLVKLVRELRQELKMNKKKADKVKADDLPLVGLSQVRHNGIDKVVFLKYDLETGNAKVEKVNKESNKHLANHYFDQMVLKYLEEQELTEE